MELTFLNSIIVLGGIAILAVFLDAVRRVLRERQGEVRLNAKVVRNAPSDSEDEFNLLSELPNGGARIVRRDDLLPPELSDAPEAVELAPAVNDESSEMLSFSALDSQVLDEQLDEPEAVAEPKARKRKAKKTLAKDTDAVETLDWLEQLDKPEPEPEPEARLPRDVDPHVFVLNVVARHDSGFSGTDVLHILLACDLRFGDMDFFHRHEHAAGRGAIQFSVANMMNPGVFNIDSMEQMSTRGLMFFLTLPGPEDMLKAFDFMYETAKVVAKNLDGEVLDERRSAVTRQSLDHMRQQIRELERRLHMIEG